MKNIKRYIIHACVQSHALENVAKNENENEREIWRVRVYEMIWDLNWGPQLILRIAQHHLNFLSISMTELNIEIYF